MAAATTTTTTTTTATCTACLVAVSQTQFRVKRRDSLIQWVALLAARTTTATAAAAAAASVGGCRVILPVLGQGRGTHDGGSRSDCGEDDESHDVGLVCLRAEWDGWTDAG